MPIDANTLKTVVYQSYRTHDVADWLRRCTRSTQSWAATQGFDYRFIDDRFFGLLSPIATRHVLSRDGALAREYSAAHGTPIYAANLAASLRGATLNGFTLTDSHFDFIVDLLDRDRSATFNEVFTA